MTTGTRDQLSDLLDQVARSLDIPDEVHEEAVRKYKELGHWLEEKDKEQGRREPSIYPQGSFRLGTVVRPISDDADYDIDLVYERDLRKTSTTQQQLKDEAGEHLESFVDFLKESHRDAPEIEPGRRCWTLQYLDQFHMDVLPAIPNDDRREKGGKMDATAIHITDVDLHEWQHSNPIGYGEWFKGRMLQQFQEKRGELARAELQTKGILLTEGMIKEAAEQVPEYKVKTPLQRAVQILKRHRDVHFKDDCDNCPASIILTTLAAKSYRNEGNLVDALVNLVRGMPDHIEYRLVNGKGVAWVPNPVNSDENFADRWQDENRPDREKKFRAWLQKVEQDMTAALKGGGIHKVVDLLGTTLGRSVVTKAASAIGLSLFQQATFGSLSMTKGTGSLVSGTTSGSTTPVRRHTFYGDHETNKDS
jgi:hypothetical protein